MYTPHVPNFLKVTYRVPEFVPRTGTNHEPCDYALNNSFSLLNCDDNDDSDLNLLGKTTTCIVDNSDSNNVEAVENTILDMVMNKIPSCSEKPSKSQDFSGVSKDFPECVVNSSKHLKYKDPGRLSFPINPTNSIIFDPLGALISVNQIARYNFVTPITTNLSSFISANK
jgi:hypothetical protein